ncbi:MAG: phosphoglycerate kinase [Kiritimatiellaeota bacterium]|nr:phosphoglycerate kinase [Kiritimatiellota bacterium]
MDKKTVRDVALQGKRVLMRVDFNVPLDGDRIADDTRIRAALPTIEYVMKQQCSLVLMSHLGRPKGARKPELSLAPVATRLKELIPWSVKMAPDTVGPEVDALVAALQPGEVLLLENTRFHPEEEGKSCTPEAQEAFAKKLAAYGNVYVNDAFGTAHRAHASTAVVCRFMPINVAGLLMEKELTYLGRATGNPDHPFVAVIGGAKVSGKLEVLDNLMKKVDAVLIGGAMAYTFLKALGHEVGKSLVEDELVGVARDTMAAAEKAGVDFLLPVDNIAADRFAEDAATRLVGRDIPTDWMALDVGPKTVDQYRQRILAARTVVWNGPMGCFEMAPFAAGTLGVCRAVADSEAVSIIGGGDSVSAVNRSGLADRMTHISTGGGASLEFLEGKPLPGVVALDDK